MVLYILSGGQSPPLLKRTYDRPIDRSYDKRQAYKDPTYEYFLGVFDGFDDDEAPIRNKTSGFQQTRFLIYERQEYDRQSFLPCRIRCITDQQNGKMSLINCSSRAFPRPTSRR